MIKTEYYSIRSDGVKLYRTYSTEGKGMGTSDEITITPVQLKALLALLGTT